MKKAALHRAAVICAIEDGTFDYAITFPHSKRSTKLEAAPQKLATIAEYLRLWLDTKESQLKASTWHGYEKVVRHQLIPEFGDIALNDLTRVRVKEWLLKLNVSNKRLTNLQSILRSALQDAVDDDEVLEVNPLRNWTFKRKDELKEDDDVAPFTSHEQQKILAECEPQFRNLVQVAFWSGLRTSELVALDWSEVDFQASTIRVVKVLTQSSKEFEEPKTRGSRRTVKMLAAAREALLAQKQHTYIKGEEVFQDPRWQARWRGDEPIRKKFWVPALARAGVAYRRPYQTRHTYASMMLSSGEPVQWVSNQMGHNNFQMLIKVYGRWMPEGNPDAGKLADQMFRSGR